MRAYNAYDPDHAGSSEAEMTKMQTDVEKQILDVVRNALTEGNILSVAHRLKIVNKVRAGLEKCSIDDGKPMLRAFLDDEMARCTNVVKLRKLALCRLGDSRYTDYREKYFDGGAIEPRTMDAAVMELALKLAEHELLRAKHGRFVSAHEGYAIILEELDELKHEVWKDRHNPDRMLKKAVRVTAMGLRFLVDIALPALTRQDDIRDAIRRPLKQAKATRPQD